jgi:hypothetical protein
LPKESKPTPKGEPRDKSNWHWLYKHPVEFSKNNHTRSDHALGVLQLTLLSRPRPVKSRKFPGNARTKASESREIDSSAASTRQIAVTISLGYPRTAAAPARRPRSLARLPGGS